MKAEKVHLALALALLAAFLGPGKSFGDDAGDVAFFEEDEDRRAVVRSYSPEEAVEQVVESVKDIENLLVSRFPGGAILRGELLLSEDMRRVTALSATMKNVINLCSWHPDALQAAADHLNGTLKENRIDSLHLSPLGKTLLLTGTPSGEEDVARVERMCKALNLPFLDGTGTLVADRRMILFEVSFLEINRDVFRQIGVDWPASTTLASAESMQLGSLSPAHSLEVTIQHLVQEGKARIISRPRLVCRSGQKATFQAGGEIPVPRTDEEGGVTVSWKPYGIILEVAPSMDQDDRIHVQILSEVSMVDHANAVEGIPGILTRRVETGLSLEMGQWIVLSGLVHSDDGERIRKVPILGEIPILGELFRSRDFQKRETELVVFLRPQPSAVSDTDGIETVLRETAR